jgi:carbon storage regulator
MIILSRRRHESVKIGEAITILVVDVQRDAVRLAVDVPKDLTVQGSAMYETFHSGRLREEQEKRHVAPNMTIGQRLRQAIQASRKSIDQLAVEIRLPSETLDELVRGGSNVPLSAVQRIASHFQLRLVGPDSAESLGG